jgi:tetratricopeptide (TPR) repeat protein
VNPKPTFCRRTGLILALALAASPAALQAQQAQPPRERPQLAEKTSEALQKLVPLQATTPPDYQGMLDIVDGVLPGVPPTSYDAAFLQNIKAKLFLGMDRYAEAIPVWERVIQLSDQHDYLDPREINDIVLYLAQIIFSEGANSKDPAVQQRAVAQASAYLKRHLTNSPKPTLATQMFYAQLLYQQAVANQNQVNTDLLRQAREVIEQSMQSTLQPAEGFYMLLLAILQQENDVERSADLLELLVKKFPQKRDYWPLLMSTYLNLASNENDDLRRREHYVRAINALERAQELGFMTTPRDNYNLVTVYLTAGQYGTATDLLHAGLRNGTIESTLANWRLLGSYYQQVNKEMHAIEALKEAAKLYPDEGMVDLQIGEIYRQLEKIPEARDYYRSALKKGGLDKPVMAYQLLAYTSMELDDWPEAHRAITEAAKSPEFANDQQMVNLKKHIEATLAEREEAEKQAEEAKEKGTPKSA